MRGRACGAGEQPTKTFDDRGIASAALSRPFSLVASRRVADWDVQTYVRSPAALTPIESVSRTASR